MLFCGVFLKHKFDSNCLVGISFNDAFANRRRGKKNVVRLMQVKYQNAFDAYCNAYCFYLIL